ncbi:hypothetical protein ACL9RL_16825 [Plantibacter sp. Mn2098]|uniref:hypothetical protein n=1 Tax=Plantibacter sp. Mn2098 TaxID=3395266 RepID=UPI003BBCEF6B
MSRRILGRERVRPTGRSDIPASLEAALAQALEKDPARRPASILDLLRRVQLAEAELGLRPSALDVPDERVIDVDALRTTDVQGTARAATARSRFRRQPGARTDSADSRTGTVSEDASATVLDARAWAPRRGRHRWLVAGVSVLVGVAVAAAIVLVVTTGLRGRQIPTVADLHATSGAKSIEFAWSAPDGTADDGYLVRVDGAAGRGQRGTSLVIDRAEAGSRVCVTVAVVRNGRPGPASDPVCVRN